ncbi:MAG: cell division protein FtsZ [Candidatus Shapirobacteria bacterium]|jgi:cell division protein FtsZ
MALIKTLAGQFAKIKVLGVGGGGNNAINSMISLDNIQGVEFIAINTDSQALLNSQAPIKIQIGEKLTKGLGAGSDPQIGEQAAEESKDKIREVLENADMVFITGGMGGGTCTGAAPIIAKIAKEELGILTIGVVTKPFLFEGTRRMTKAEEGIRELKQHLDTLVVIPNQKVMEVVNSQTTMIDAFKIADSVLNKGTKAIADLITTPGLINLDFADIKSIMNNAGTALMGVGEAEGDNKAREAVSAAIDSPLVDVDIRGARGVLINITGGPDLTMAEIEDAAQTITHSTSPDANIIFGATIDPELKGKIRITVIATGFSTDRPKSYSQAPIKLIEENHPSPQVQQLMNDQEIPEGIDIVDEFDIPAFLRKK